MDGRRAQPANASLIVDLNTIPSAAIERIETITGGASAVYGADALAGEVAPGFSREQILRPPKEDPRAEDGVFGRVGGLLRELSSGGSIG